jgi:tyrosyl-tRNA synthetase
MLHQLVPRLRARGCLADVSTEALGPWLAARLAAAAASNGGGRSAPPVSAYAGFDPTAPSLHLGSMAVIVALARLQREGVRPIALIGGATGLIGDPTGKSADRPLLTADTVATNAAGIRRSLETMLDFGDGANGSNAAYSGSRRVSAACVNNADFYAGMGVLAFMRDVGTHFRLSAMLAKDSVKSRLESAGGARGSVGSSSSGRTPAVSETDAAPTGSIVAASGRPSAPAAGASTAAAGGISYTEFSYQIFQAYDFHVLRRSHGAVLQVGGSDQWGNITAGIELVRRCADGAGAGAEVHGLTVPLLTGPGGRKFGKSEGNAVWLDPALTSHHALYQYLLNTPDDGVGRLLRLITLLEEEQVAAAEAAQAAKPQAKPAQRLLADTVTAMVRGPEGVAAARRAAVLLFGGRGVWAAGGEGGGSGGSGGSGGGASAGEAVAVASGEGEGEDPAAALRRMTAADILAVADTGDVPLHTMPAAAYIGAPLVDTLVAAGATKSKADARRLVAGGGVYVNFVRVPPAAEARGRAEDVVAGCVVVLGAGKKKMTLLRLTP